MKSNLTLKWKINSINQTGQKIYRQINEDPETLIATLDAVTTTYTDLDVLTDNPASVKYRITSFGTYRGSETSESVTASYEEQPEYTIYWTGGLPYKGNTMFAQVTVEPEPTDWIEPTWSTTTPDILEIANGNQVLLKAAGTGVLVATFTPELSISADMEVKEYKAFKAITVAGDVEMVTPRRVVVTLAGEVVPEPEPVFVGGENQWTYQITTDAQSELTVTNHYTAEPSLFINFNKGIYEVVDWFEGGSYTAPRLGVDIEHVPTTAPIGVSNYIDTFKGASRFNDPNINEWDTENVAHLGGTFTDCTSFNQPLTNWKVENVHTASNLFKGCTAFNSDISHLQFTKLEYAQSMFSGATIFNQPIESVINSHMLSVVEGMFQNAKAFNQPLNGLDVSAVFFFKDLFNGATSFNQPLDQWQLSSSNNQLTAMFSGATSFDQPLADWDVSKTTIMTNMFAHTTYLDRHDLSGWCVSNIPNAPEGFAGDATTTANLPVWGTCPGPAPQPGNSDETVLSVDVTNYPNATDRVIRVAGGVEGARLLSPSTGVITSEAVSGATQFTLPEGYVGDVAFKTTITQSPIITIPSETLAKPILLKLVKFSETVKRISYSSKAAFTVPKVLPAFVTSLDRMFANATNFNDPNVSLWDTANVTNLSSTFLNASNFNQPLNDWNTGNVIEMTSLFEGAAKFNQTLASWVISKVKNLTSVFKGAKAFNQNINNWDVSNVTDLSTTFLNASAFNQPLNGWNVAKVTTMWFTFSGASLFNQELSDWVTSSCTSMTAMFQNAINFNRNISTWDVSKVTLFNTMFYGASKFNTPLADWVTAAATNMSEMFYDAVAFSQDLSSWCVSNITTEPQGFATNAGGLIKPVWGTCPSKAESVSIVSVDELMVDLTEPMKFNTSEGVVVNSTTWSVSDDAVASIDENGILTGKTVGVVDVEVLVNQNLKDTVEVPITAKQIIEEPSDPELVVNGGIHLTWGIASTHQVEQRLYRKVDGGEETKIATLGPEITTYEDVGIDPTTVTRLDYRIESIGIYRGEETVKSTPVQSFVKPTDPEMGTPFVFISPTTSIMITSPDPLYVKVVALMEPDKSTILESTLDGEHHVIDHELTSDPSYTEIHVLNGDNPNIYTSFEVVSDIQDVSAWGDYDWGDRPIGIEWNRATTWTYPNHPPKTTNLTGLFKGAAIYPAISVWDVSGVKVMDYMFENATFTANTGFPFGWWDLGNVTSMTGMFKGAVNYNDDLTNWCLPNVLTEPTDFATGSGITAENKPVWGTCPVRRAALLVTVNDSGTSPQSIPMNTQSPYFGASLVRLDANGDPSYPLSGFTVISKEKTVSDPTVLSIDEDDQITLHKPGTVTITATWKIKATYQDTYTASIEITVTE